MLQGIEHARGYADRTDAITRPDACIRNAKEQESGDRWCHRCWRGVDRHKSLCAEGIFDPEAYVVKTGEGSAARWHRSKTPF